MTKEPTFYRLSHSAFWGDYGRILITGWVDRRRPKCFNLYSKNSDIHERTYPLDLHRTGPFMPEISLPGMATIIVSQSCKTMIEGLLANKFRKVTKKQVVDLDWHKWDWKSDFPETHPHGGEPENYILNKAHSEAVSKQMGEVWELCLELGMYVETRDRSTEPFSGYDLCFDLDTWNGDDVFWVKTLQGGGPWIVVSKRGKEILSNADKNSFLQFEQCLTKQ